MLFNRARYWMSSQLIWLGILVLPDEYTKTWMRTGITIACEGIEGNIELTPEGGEEEIPESVH